MTKPDGKEVPTFQKSNGVDIQIGKYRRSRFWGIWINGELLAVTVYKRGAISICKQVVARETREGREKDRDESDSCNVQE